MAILKIARMGHPVLRTPADPVADPTAPAVRHLVGDMIETMEDAPGVGLAAPQVHHGLRIVVFRVASSTDDGAVEEDGDGAPVPLTVLINPQIEALDGDMETGWESCLSVPGLTGPVPRHARIRYRGLDLDGAAVERTAEGLHARVVQHECDHLDAILYPQRMTDLSRLGFADEVRRHPRNADRPEEE